MRIVGSSCFALILCLSLGTAISQAQPAPDGDKAPGQAAPAAPKSDAADQGPATDQPKSDQGKAEPEPAQPAASTPAEPQQVTLTIATWGGAYQQSQERAFFEPFEKSTGHEVSAVAHGGTLRALKEQAQGGNPAWDIVDLSSRLLDEACADGLLVKLPGSLSGPSGSEDFMPGALRECGIGSVAWSAVPVYDTRAYRKRAPASAKDFFDLAKFPGKRSLPKGPRYTMELALLAGGVAPADVYARLSTPEGVTQAFEMLEKIRGETLWWDKASEPLAHLRDGKAAMALAFNGRAFSAIVAERQPLAILWSGQIYDMNYWGIVAGSRHEEEARDFIAFATEPRQLAQQTRWFPYGPVRKSALAHVSTHAEMPLDMSDYLPTAESNMKLALAYNPTFWAGAEAAMTQRFEAWLAGEIDAAGLRREVAPSQAPLPVQSPVKPDRETR